MAFSYYPQYARGNPYGNLAPAPTTVRALLPKKKRKKAAPTKRSAPAPVSIPGQLSQDDALQQVLGYLQPVFDAQDARINAAYDAQQRAVQQAYEALAKYGQGVGPAIQNAYQGAAKDTAAFGKGFSDAVSQLSSGHASDATAALAAQGGPQTVTSGLANGGGDALYAMGGAIPGSQLEREGAAFTSAASFLPTEAAGLGAGAIRDLGQQRIQDLLSAGQDRPQTIQEAVQKLLDESYSRQQDALKLANQTSPAAKVTYRNLANGQVGTFSNGKLIRVSGPPKSSVASEGHYSTSHLANGQFVTTLNGQPISKPWGPKKSGKGKASPLSPRIDVTGDTITAYDKRTGKVLWRKKRPAGATSSSGSTTPAAPNVDQRGRIVNRTDGVTPTQARKYKATAYSWSKSWHNDGGKLEDDNHNPVQVSPLELLRTLVNEQGIPYDIAVRQMARWTPAARSWLKSGINPLTGQSTRSSKKNVSNVTEITDAPGYEPSKGLVQLPTHFSGTHVTDGHENIQGSSPLWSQPSKTAHDFMAPAGAPVNSPVSGTIEYFHPSGAQGGGSMLIRGDDGYEYWLGHIEGGIPGGRITAGQQIAVIANQSVSAPHVHIDRRPLAGSV